MCDAEIITPASALYFLTRNATAGVGTTPNNTTLAPTDVSPAASALSSISPEILVSLPIINVGCFTSSLVNTIAAALPIARAKSTVISLFAMPLAPSVPKSLPIFINLFQ